MTWDHTTLVFCQLPKWKLDKGFLRKIKIQHYVKMAKVKEKFRKIVEITAVIPSVKFSFTSDGPDPYLRTSSASKGKCGIRKTIFSRTGQRTRKFSKNGSFFRLFSAFFSQLFLFSLNFKSHTFWPKPIIKTGTQKEKFAAVFVRSIFIKAFFSKLIH